MDQNLERFIRYVKIDTQSDENSLTTPSTEKQYNLLNLLKEELKALDIDSEIDEHGRLYAKVKGEEGYPTIGLNSHVDTASELTGKNVKPQIIENYDGGTIKLNDEYSMSPDQFPILKDHIGDTLVVTSGDTLLGGDDKAGIAIIMSVLAYFHDHPEIKHCPIAILFTPDEEIGRGAEYFDKDKFGADFAYTLDGECGEGIMAENFNAASVSIKVKGVLAHPGNAKDIMQNPVRILADICASWPENKLPETTCGREGFLCFTNIAADFEKGSLNAMVRDFDENKLNASISFLKEIIKEKQLKYPGCEFEIKVTYPYKNMKPIIDKYPNILKLAEDAFAECGLNHEGKPIRGGTDGAALSYMGLPTPNIDAGYGTPHGPFEWASLDMMEKITKALTIIVQNNTVKQK